MLCVNSSEYGEIIMVHDPEGSAARFVSLANSELTNAYDIAFRDGIMQAIEELGIDVNIESVIITGHDHKARLLAYYLPSVVKMAGELIAIFGRFRADMASHRDEPAQLEIIKARYVKLFERQTRSIRNRIALVAGGLTWSAAELGYAAVAESEGRLIYWELDSGADHCTACPALADGSPYASISELGGVPGSDITDCGGKCRCHLWIE